MSGSRAGHRKPHQSMSSRDTLLAPGILVRPVLLDQEGPNEDDERLGEYQNELLGLIRRILLLEPSAGPITQQDLRLLGIMRAQVHGFIVNTVLCQQNIEDVNAGPPRVLARYVSTSVAHELLPLAEDQRCQVISSSKEDADTYLAVIKEKWLGGDFCIWESNLSFPGCLVALVRMLRFDCIRYALPAVHESQSVDEQDTPYYHYPLILLAWLFVTGQLILLRPEATFREPRLLETILRRTDAFRGNIRRRIFPPTDLADVDQDGSLSEYPFHLYQKFLRQAQR